MARKRRTGLRRGIVLAECAVVYPLTMFLLLGIVVTGLGVFRYQQVASLAKQGARWAAVRGEKYQSEQVKSAPTSADVLAYVKTRAAGLDPGLLTCTTFAMTKGTGATVTVTLSYRWTPEVFTSAVTLKSTSVATVTY